MDKIRQISSELRDWIISTLNNGVSPVAIADAMIKKGFDPKFAYEALFRIVGNESIKTSETNLNTYQSELPEIGKKGNVITTTDREVKVLSRVEKPFILHLDHVLSIEECDELINLSKDRLQPSRIVDPTTGEEKVAPGRTSKGMHYTIRENALITTIENRIAGLTDFPVENGEGLQVLNYDIGEEYKQHFDYFPPNKVDHDKGGQRVGTFLIYLNDVIEGGETVFPKAGVSIVPKKGSAVYFHYGNSKEQVDRMSVHSSVPIVKGEKWVATKWIRQGKIY
ncbi:prolyl 4-hydroxylase [Mesobacillus persicus]|uniref:Prolyl 4-hydroxylase n=1 Tax=Mesobacillus persicus TaxID=930146 RepID=A0A1H7W3U3_9BACI|nr:2OG-Fe(II) oxygenase [Mesobacillus persicus]SEM15715.1 prolyl 4-hydroxylase [Mesobacillus persicus]